MNQYAGDPATVGEMESSIAKSADIHTGKNGEAPSTSLVIDTEKDTRQKSIDMPVTTHTQSEIVGVLSVSSIRDRMAFGTLRKRNPIPVRFVMGCENACSTETEIATPNTGSEEHSGVGIKPLRDFAVPAASDISVGNNSNSTNESGVVDGGPTDFMTVGGLSGVVVRHPQRMLDHQIGVSENETVGTVDVGVKSSGVAVSMAIIARTAIRQSGRGVKANGLIIERKLLEDFSNRIGIPRQSEKYISSTPFTAYATQRFCETPGFAAIAEWLKMPRKQYKPKIITCPPPRADLTTKDPLATDKKYFSGVYRDLFSIAQAEAMSKLSVPQQLDMEASSGKISVARNAKKKLPLFAAAHLCRSMVNKSAVNVKQPKVPAIGSAWKKLENQKTIKISPKAATRPSKVPAKPNDPQVARKVSSISLIIEPKSEQKIFNVPTMSVVVPTESPLVIVPSMAGSLTDVNPNGPKGQGSMKHELDTKPTIVCKCIFDRNPEEFRQPTVKPKSAAQILFGAALGGLPPKGAVILPPLFSARYSPPKNQNSSLPPQGHPDNGGIPADRQPPAQKCASPPLKSLIAVREFFRTQYSQENRYDRILGHENRYHKYLNPEGGDKGPLRFLGLVLNEVALDKARLEREEREEREERKKRKSKRMPRKVFERKLEWE